MTKYDLEGRLLAFSKSVFIFSKTIKQEATNKPIISQLVRSSGSVGANYIEANEALSKKDFVYRVKIARKEAKESAYWLEIISDYDNTGQAKKLLEESVEIKKILSAIILKSE
mgnify:CR=1 FL=1